MPSVIECNSAECGTPLAGNPTIGVELEVEYNGENITQKALEVKSALNAEGERVIIKGDGSLSHGFEIVTRPMGREFHTRLWGNLFSSEVKRGLSSWDTQTCGLHTHIPKFNDTGKDASTILAVEHPAIRNFILSLAGRENSRWCKFHTIRNKADASRFLGSRNRSCDRYVAVNTNSRHNTHEARIFRGNLRSNSILLAVEFAEAMHKFGEGEKSVRTEEGFLDFLQYPEGRTPSHKWPNLFAFVEEYRSMQSQVQREMRSRMWRERESSTLESGMSVETRLALLNGRGNFNSPLEFLAEELRASWIVPSLSCDQLARRLRRPNKEGRENNPPRCFALCNGIPFVFEPTASAWFAISESGLAKIAECVAVSVQNLKNRIENNGWACIAFDMLGHNCGKVV